jgi:hypothetical protein
VGRVLALLFVAYAALTLWVTLHHEPWRDEADTWLIARDATIAETLRIPAHRGVPLLWDAMLKPFAKAGAPYLAQQLLNLACAWGAVLLLIRSRAFPPLLKAIFPFSLYASFEYAAIARPYALLMLLLFAMAEWWRTREEQPLRLAVVVALLANVTVHGLIAAAVAGAVLTRELLRSRVCKEIDQPRHPEPRRRRRISKCDGRTHRGRSSHFEILRYGQDDGVGRSGAMDLRARRFGAIAVMLIGGLVSVAQLWPRPGGQRVYQLVSLDTVWYSLATAFFPELRIETGTVLALFVLIVVTIAIGRRFAAVAFLWTTLVAVMVVFVWVWMGGPRHAGILLVLTLTAVWIADAYGAFRIERLAMAALTVALAWSIVPAYRSWRDETRYAYGGGRAMADHIRTHELERANFAGGALMWNSFLVDLPRTRVWLAPRGEYGSFSKWERRDSAMTAEEAIRAAQTHFGGQPWFLMLSRPLPAAFERQFRLRHATPELQWGQRDERYWLYESVTP